MPVADLKASVNSLANALTALLSCTSALPFRRGKQLCFSFFLHASSVSITLRATTRIIRTAITDIKTASRATNAGGLEASEVTVGGLVVLLVVSTGDEGPGVVTVQCYDR